jgi:hypothetical protein
MERPISLGQLPSRHDRFGVDSFDTPNVESDPVILISYQYHPQPKQEQERFVATADVLAAQFNLPTLGRGQYGDGTIIGIIRGEGRVGGQYGLSVRQDTFVLYTTRGTPIEISRPRVCRFGLSHERFPSRTGYQSRYTNFLTRSF